MALVGLLRLPAAVAYVVVATSTVGDTAASCCYCYCSTAPLQSYICSCCLLPPISVAASAADSVAAVVVI